MTPLLLKEFTNRTGRTSAEVRKKIQRGAWKEGVHVVKDPDGRWNVIWEAYLRWLGLESKAESMPRKKVEVNPINGKVSKRGGSKKVNPYKV